MAIVNATPDSFSDGGRFLAADEAVAHALACVKNGAHIIDIGGESTRPGADAVTEQEEQDRVLPVVERLAKETDALLSIDTYRASTARLTLEAGAHIVNDVYGLQKDSDMAGVIAAKQAGNFNSNAIFFCKNFGWEYFIAFRKAGCCVFHIGLMMYLQPAI